MTDEERFVKPGHVTHYDSMSSPRSSSEITRKFGLVADLDFVNSAGTRRRAVERREVARRHGSRASTCDQILLQRVTSLAQ